MHNIWSIDVAFMIREAGVNTYSTSFVNKVLMRRAMEKSLWLIMGHCMVLKEWKKRAICKSGSIPKNLVMVTNPQCIT